MMIDRGSKLVDPFFMCLVDLNEKIDNFDSSCVENARDGKQTSMILDNRAAYGGIVKILVVMCSLS